MARNDSERREAITPLYYNPSADFARWATVGPAD